MNRANERSDLVYKYLQNIGKKLWDFIKTILPH